jgi:3-hydroxyacyl-[acyl-carrier-protein] dehydratase
MSELPPLDYAAIEKLLPHRAPFLLIDRLENVISGESAVGIKAVSGNEPYFVGHFPGHPIMPGVLIVEAMAQAAGALAMLSQEDTEHGKLVFLASVDKTRFKRPVTPGILLELQVKKVASKGPLWKFSGTAMSNGIVMAQAEFSAMVVDGDR